MKLLKFFIIVVFYFSFINVVYAEEITLEDIYNELKLSEITSDIYNSEIIYENSQISIKYTFKDNSSNETYFDPKEFITVIYGNDIITYNSGGDKLRDEKGYLPKENDKDITELIKTEEKWFTKLIDVLNKLTNNRFSEYSLSKTYFCDYELGLCVINAGTKDYEFTNNYDILYWQAQFRLNKKLIEIENVTENTADVVYYGLYVTGISTNICISSLVIADSEDNIVNDVEIKKARDDLQIYNIKFSNLKPNTKYSYKYKNACRIGYVDNITFTTLETIIEDKENNDNKPTDTENTDNDILNDEDNDEDNIDNPKTGNELTIIVSSLIILGIIINRYTKKNNKLY